VYDFVLSLPSKCCTLKGGMLRVCAITTYHRSKHTQHGKHQTA